MVDRITQRVNFGNLRPQAKTVDTFHRPDSRDLDKFVDWADSRLKATSGLIDSMGGAYISYRESKQEEVRLKARADATKNYYDPERKNNPDSKKHLDPEYNSWKVYQDEVDRRIDQLDGIKAGKELIKDDSFVNNIFKIHQKRKQKFIKAKGNEDNPDYDPNITEELVFQEERDKKFNEVTKGKGEAFIQKYTEALSVVEEKFFDRLQKQNIARRVNLTSRMVEEFMNDGDAIYKFSDMVKMNDGVKKKESQKDFYAKLGLIKQESIASGLDEPHAQVVVIQSVFSYANSLAKRTVDQDAGEITPEEEKKLMMIMEAFQENDGEKSFFKNGGSVAGNAEFEQVTTEGLNRINRMLYKYDEDNEKDSDERLTRDASLKIDQYYSKLFKGDFGSLEEADTWIKTNLQYKEDGTTPRDWTLKVNIPVADMLGKYNTFSRSGGAGNPDLFIRTKIDILTNREKYQGLIQAKDNFFKTKDHKIGPKKYDLSTLSTSEINSLIDLSFPSERQDTSLEKVELNNLNRRMYAPFGSKEQFDLMLRNSEFSDAVTDIQVQWNTDYQEWYYENGYSSRNQPTLEEKRKYFKSKRGEYAEQIKKLQGIATNAEEVRSRVMIDLENIDLTLPKEYLELEDGVPENLYRDLLYFNAPSVWNEYYGPNSENPMPEPPLRLFGKDVKTNKQRIEVLEAVQRYIYNVPKGQEPTGKRSYGAFVEKHISNDITFVFWNMLTNARTNFYKANE